MNYQVVFFGFPEEAFCVNCARPVKVDEKVLRVSRLLGDRPDQLFCPKCGSQLHMFCQCCGINPAAVRDYRENGYGGIGKFYVCACCLWLSDKHFRGLYRSRNKKAYIRRVIGCKLSEWKQNGMKPFSR